MTAMSKDDFDEGVRNRKGKGDDQKSVKVPGPPRFEERFEEDVDKFGRWRPEDVFDDEDSSPLKKWENFDKKEAEMQAARHFCR